MSHRKCELGHLPSDTTKSRAGAYPQSKPLLYRTLSAAVYDIDVNIIEVEVDISGVKIGLPVCGELSLDAKIRGVRGALLIAIEARARKISRLIVPELNAKEAAMVQPVAVYPARYALQPKRIADAIQYRTLDRTFWA
jgi:hypothetical protein